MVKMRPHGNPDRLDRAIFARVAAGDRGALAEAYARHGPMAYRHALWILRHPADAEDVVQAVFLTLATRGAVLLGVRRPASYIGAMVHHEASAQRRSREQTPAIDAEILLAAAREPALEVERITLGRALAELDAVQREVVFLRVYAGFTLREIGMMTGFSLFTVASRYRLALSRLRRELETEAP
jgi:RNA polymerase sigma-70 factor (ECF subfamily)